MKIVLIENGIIADIQDHESVGSAKAKFPSYEIEEVPAGCSASRGEKRSIFDSSFLRRKISDCVKDGSVIVEEGMILDGETIRAKTTIELMAEGKKEIPKGNKLNNTKTSLEQKTLTEQVADGEITQAEADEIKSQTTIMNRRTAYVAESDGLYLAAQYDGTESAMTAWKAKVAEIKARYPKE